MDQTHRSSLDKTTASISTKEYSDNGKRLCKVTDFLNNKSSNKVKKGKFEKCTDWCKNNGGRSSIIKEVCKKYMIELYNNYRSFSRQYKKT